MTFEGYIESVCKIKAKEPSWRIGQTYFNVLMEIRTDLSEQIQGSPIDPFYNDEVIEDFLKFLVKSW